MTDAKEYARALFELAQESEKTEAVVDSLNLINSAFSENPEYKNLLDTPALPKAEKLSLIDSAFSSLNGYAVNTLKILCERHAVHLFQKVKTEFEKLYDDVRGIERVEAITAISMTDAQITAMTNKLQAITGKTVIIKNIVDKTVLGGVILRYSGIQLDGSVKKRLEDFRKSLSNTVI